MQISKVDPNVAAAVTPPNAATAWMAPLRQFAHCWLELRCGCAEARRLKVFGLVYIGCHETLSDVLPRLKCSRCGQAPSEVWLCETAIRLREGLGIVPGWSVLVWP